MINSEYLKNLNNAQKEAVLHIHGPLLIVAVQDRVKQKFKLQGLLILLKKRSLSKPNFICHVYNKAAREMQNRISSILKAEAVGLNWLGTFHSICAKLLRKHASAVGLSSNFTIIDTDDQVRLIKIYVKQKIST